MSTPNNLKKKIAILKKAPIKEVILNVVEVCKSLYKDDKITPIRIDATVEYLLHSYQSQLPKKQPKWKQVDIEDSIKEIKEENTRKNGNSRHPKYG